METVASGDSARKVDRSVECRLLATAAIFAAGLSLGLAGCADTGASPARTEGGGIYKIGNPYQVQGVWYYPAVDYAYDKVGIASWYGPNFRGRTTANGETFDPDAMTAAHPTLPLPSMVEVTNLENGRSVRLRVNDRGPYRSDRIIDVSERAAKKLGFYGQGTARVRVRVLSDESRQLALRAMGRTPAVGAIPQVVSAPVGKVASQDLAPPGTAAGAAGPDGSPIALIPRAEAAERPLPTAAGDSRSGGAGPQRTARTQSPRGTATAAATRFFVQAASFAKQSNARRLKQRLSALKPALGPVEIVPVAVSGRSYYRVRVGPARGQAQAALLLDRLMAQGLSDAKVIAD